MPKDTTVADVMYSVHLAVIIIDVTFLFTILTSKLYDQHHVKCIDCKA